MVSKSYPSGERKLEALAVVTVCTSSSFSSRPQSRERGIGPKPGVVWAPSVTPITSVMTIPAADTSRGRQFSVHPFNSVEPCCDPHVTKGEAEVPRGSVCRAVFRTQVFRPYCSTLSGTSVQTERADNAQHGRWNISHHLPTLWPDSQPYKVPENQGGALWKCAYFLKILLLSSVLLLFV